MTDVILVNKHDEPIGKMEKLLAHQKGLLHRAFSIFLFNENMQMLIQKRNINKYHSGGLWSNACCSHPKPGEKIIDASLRRLIEELNVECQLKKAFSFVYKVDFKNQLIEYEYDHVLIGKINKTPKFNPEEISELKWVSLENLLIDLKINSDKYSYWFQIIMKDYFYKIEKQLNEGL